MKIPWHQWLPFRRSRIVGQVESADEIPERLPTHGAVLVISGGLAKWIAFDCPCRSGHRVLLNTDPQRRPTWAISSSIRGALSITPSIDFREDGRRCHYFVRDGRIVWAKG